MLNTQSIKQLAGGMINSDLLKKSSTCTPLSASDLKISDTRSGRKSKNGRKGNQQARGQKVENQGRTTLLRSDLDWNGDIKDVSNGNNQQQLIEETIVKKLANRNKSVDYGDQKVFEEVENVPSWKRGSGENQSSDVKSCDPDKSIAIKSSSKLQTDEKQAEFKAQLVWTNIILFVILHSCIPISIYILMTQLPIYTLMYSLLLVYASGVGITAGAHRLWSHKSYKAGLTVETLLMILQTMAGQNSIYTWSRDHRVHHKFSETNADPHNIKRGFFFAHMGWLCCKKHPDVKEKGKLIDMSDLEANKVVMFQHRHFWWLAIMFTVLVPTMIPVLLWNERFWTSFVISFMLRYLTLLHGTWLVNSAAHYHGSRPYDVNIEARESPSAIYTGFGEGFHNYHHTFPYDYSTSEFGRYFNITTAFIDLCATLGLVKDRRKVDSNTILRRRLRTGNLCEEELHNLDQKCVGSLRSNSEIIQKTIEEVDESTGNATPLSRRRINGRTFAPLSNMIHELPYISGLTSMKYTM